MSPPRTLPAELWIYVFDLVIEDHNIFDYSLPDSFSESSWIKLVYGNWTLRTPQEHINHWQRQRYRLLKAIASTCKTFRHLVTEYLFKGLFFEDPSSVQKLCALFDSDRHLGKWTRRLHVFRYFAGHGRTLEEMQDALTAVIRHCRRLEILILEWSMGSAFSSIADTICTYCPRRLRTIQLIVPSLETARIIWMLDSLSSLVTVQLEFTGPADPDGGHLGAASGLALTFPKIQHLRLRGYVTEFVEEASNWEFPALDSLTFDFVNLRDELPDVIEFLEHHGSQLTYFDIDCITPYEVNDMLNLCPRLVTFAFNPDWRLPLDQTAPTSASLLVNRPHPTITTIGCHQLLSAFNAGYTATRHHDPITTHFVRRSNDLNFAALNTRNFPNLQRIRVLSRSLLRDLETSNGPDGVCFERWERWWKQCSIQNIRLEDCTGEELGQLPMDSDDEGDDISEVEEEQAHEMLRFTGMPSDTLAVVRSLLEECRNFSTDTSPAHRLSTQYFQLGY